MTDEQRLAHVLSFIERVDLGYLTPCWIWPRATSKGYGKVWNGAGYSQVHRYIYERLVGPIQSTLDHLCRVILCCNPEHLEDVTQRVNNLRGQAPNIQRHRSDTCKHGHDLNNSWIDRNGTRKCRECNRLRAAARRASST